MDLHQLKLHLQAQIFRRPSPHYRVRAILRGGGIPGMEGLATFLATEAPKHHKIDSDLKAEWGKVSMQLSNGIDLETSLLNVSISSLLEQVIGDLTHSFILESEKSVLSQSLFRRKNIKAYSVNAAPD